MYKFDLLEGGRGYKLTTDDMSVDDLYCEYCLKKLTDKNGFASFYFVKKQLIKVCDECVMNDKVDKSIRARVYLHKKKKDLYQPIEYMKITELQIIKQKEQVLDG